MTENKKDPISLKILEAYTRDVGRGVARIDYDSMDELGASTGDTLQIKGGKRISVVKCLPLYPSDEGKGMIRVDRLMRNNIGSDLGMTISVTKVKAFEAKTITVTPTEAIPPIDERYLTDCLEGVPMVKDDVLLVPYFGGRLTFRILEIDPKDNPVICSSKTVFKIIERKEMFEKYSIIAQSFLNEEERLLKELKDLVTNPYTDKTSDQILSIDQSLEKLHKSKKIAMHYLKEEVFTKQSDPVETPKSEGSTEEVKK